VPHDEKTAERLRRALAKEKAVDEIKMFGGLCFTLRGRMCVGLLGKDLVARVTPELYDKALKEPHVRPMDFTGRPMRGFLFVAPAGYRTPASLTRWIRRGAEAGARLKPRA